MGNFFTKKAEVTLDDGSTISISDKTEVEPADEAIHPGSTAISSDKIECEEDKDVLDNGISSSDKTDLEPVVTIDEIGYEGCCEEHIKYLLSLIHIEFYGQTTTGYDTDEADTTKILNLGLHLSLLHKLITSYENVEDFTGSEEEYLELLWFCAKERVRENETPESCYERILENSERFVKMYHARGVRSWDMGHQDYWGTRQQMLSGKVIADWIDEEHGPLDPIFGTLLFPATGRTGYNDSPLHVLLFDERGCMAYHTTAHDAFGYLLNYHGIGPGYDYLSYKLFDAACILAGHLSGLSFWKSVIKVIDDKQKKIKHVLL